MVPQTHTLDVVLEVYNPPFVLPSVCQSCTLRNLEKH